MAKIYLKKYIQPFRQWKRTLNGDMVVRVYLRFSVCGTLIVCSMTRSLSNKLCYLQITFYPEENFTLNIHFSEFVQKLNQNFFFLL